MRWRFEGASPAPASMLAAHDLQLYMPGGRSSVVAVRALHILSSCTPCSLRLSKTFPDVLWHGSAHLLLLHAVIAALSAVCAAIPWRVMPGMLEASGITCRYRLKA